MYLYSLVIRARCYSLRYHQIFVNFLWTVSTLINCRKIKELTYSRIKHLPALPMSQKFLSHLVINYILIYCLMFQLHCAVKDGGGILASWQGKYMCAIQSILLKSSLAFIVSKGLFVLLHRETFLFFVAIQNPLYTIYIARENTTLQNNNVGIFVGMPLPCLLSTTVHVLMQRIYLLLKLCTHIRVFVLQKMYSHTHTSTKLSTLFFS